MMETVDVKPGHDQLNALVAGLCLLCALILMLPQLAMPLSLLLPLLACPLTGKKQEPLAYLAAAIPAVASLIAGYDGLYAVSLALVTAFPLAATRLLPPSRRVGLEGTLWYMGAVAAGLLAVMASATWALGGPLWQKLTDGWIQALSHYEKAGLLLYRFAASGLIPMPEGYENSQILMHVFEPAVIRQMLLSLRRVLESLMFDMLPMFFIQASMIVGLFTALRVQRINGVVLVLEARTVTEKKARVAVPTGFRMIALPPKVRWPLTMMAMAALVLWMFDDSLSQILGQMCYSTFETAFMLVGAAVLVCLLSAKHPKKKSLFGVLVAALYVIAPFLLFLIGLTDQTFHYRIKHSKSTD